MNCFSYTKKIDKYSFLETKVVLNFLDILKSKQNNLLFFM